MTKNLKNAPKDFPKAKNVYSGKMMTIDLKWVDKEISNLEKLIKNKEAEVASSNPKDQEKNFTGIVFVVLSRPSDCLKVIKKEPSYRTFVNILKKLIGKFFPGQAGNKSLWIWERSPEPGDIFWENLYYNDFQRFYYSIYSVFLTLGVLILSFLIVLGLETIQDKQLEWKEDNEIVIGVQKKPRGLFI